MNRVLRELEADKQLPGIGDAYAEWSGVTRIIQVKKREGDVSGRREIMSIEKRSGDGSQWQRMSRGQVPENPGC